MLPWIMGAGMAAGIGGSVFSGIMGKQAAKRQAEALRRSTEEAKQYHREYRDLAQGWLKPFQATGQKANQSLSDILSGKINLDDMVQTSSLFKFQQQEGSRNINRQLRARGLYGSGAGLETLAKFETQLLGEEGERTMGRLFRLSDSGQQAAGTLANIDQATGRSLADLTMGGGSAAANAVYQGDMSIANLGREIGGQLQSGAMGMAQYQMMQPFLNKMAGGSSAEQNALARMAQMEEANAAQQESIGTYLRTDALLNRELGVKPMIPPLNEYSMSGMEGQGWSSFK